MKQPSTRAAVTEIFSAARAALQWRLLVLWSALLLVPTAMLALPVWRLFGGALDHSAHAATLAHQVDALGAFDLIAMFRSESGVVETAGALALIVTLLLAPLLSGMAVTAVRAATPAGWRQLVAGALALYGRMARMLAWSAVPLGAALALGGWILHLVATHNQDALTESAAGTATLWGRVAAFALFAIAHATVDAGRAVLAAEPRRTSAVKAWWRGLGLLWRRPIALLGAWCAVGAAGLLVAGACALLRIQVAPLGAGAIVLGLVLTQCAALGLAWSRQARLFALVALRRTGATSTLEKAAFASI